MHNSLMDGYKLAEKVRDCKETLRKLITETEEMLEAKPDTHISSSVKEDLSSIREKTRKLEGMI